MDPTATYENLIDAIQAADWDTVIELSNALEDWLDRGGFAPGQSDAESARAFAVAAHVTAVHMRNAGR